MSIRAHLTRFLLLGMIPLVVATGAGLYVFVRRALLARVDDALFARAGALSSMVKVEAGTIELDFAGEATPTARGERAEGHVRAEFFELWTLDSRGEARVLERSASLGGTDLPLPPDQRTGGVSPTAWNGPLATGHEGRLAALRFTPRADPEAEDHADSAPTDGPTNTPDVLLVVAQSRHDLDRTLAVLAGALSAAGLALAAGMTFAVRVALARGLRPIADLVDQVEAIGPSDLGARLGTSGTPIELAPLALRTNAMLDRLAAAFEREKRLGASAAHELRTPIAEIRAVSELALSRNRAPEEYRRSLSTILDAAARMGNSADAVLRLARVQSGLEPPALERVDAAESLRPAWQRWITPLEARNIRVRAGIPVGTFVRADRAMLGVVFDNLCANAAEHAAENGEVRAEVSTDARPMVTLIISNTMPGADDHHPPMTESPEPLHAGLGLLIARSMLEACNGSLSTHQEGGCFVATIHLRSNDSARPPAGGPP